MASRGRHAVFTVGFIANEAAQWETHAGGFGWTPRADVCETPDALHYEIELPGVSETDITLRFENGLLIVEGTRPPRTRPGPSRCLQVEIEYGAFRRALPVPRDADATLIEAHSEAGLLSITVPKTRAAANRNVKIDVS